MNLRNLAVCLAACSALALTACGDDDEDTQTTGSTTTTATTATTQEPATAEGAKLEDIEPRASKPNISGGDAQVEEFVQSYADDAISYWEQVFENSQETYERPTAQVLSSAGEACGKPFDPADMGYNVCADPNGASTLTYGGARLERLRSEVGDAAAAFIAGYGVALDANDQLAGEPIRNSQPIDEAFSQVAACFTGAWIRNLDDRKLLDATDADEVLTLAEGFVEGADADLKRAVVIDGYQNNVGFCQSEYGGVGGE